MIGLVLTTTSMGALIPILDNAGVSDKPFGAWFGAGALGEFAPIIAISVLLIGDNPGAKGCGSVRSWSSRLRWCSSEPADRRASMHSSRAT